jgi:hypothetical protein
MSGESDESFSNARQAMTLAEELGAPALTSRAWPCG